MRLLCIANTSNDLPSECLVDPRVLKPGKTFAVTVGASYVVYAVTVYRGFAWYYVLDDNELEYPVWKPAPLFELESGAIPGGWVLGYVRSEKEDVGYPLLSFAEWANDRTFYERLVDGDDDAVAVFDRQRIEAEFV